MSAESLLALLVGAVAIEAALILCIFIKIRKGNGP